MKRIVRLTESDLARIVRRVISEQGGADWSTYVAASQKIPKGSMLTSVAYNGVDAVGFNVSNYIDSSKTWFKDSKEYFYGCPSKGGDGQFTDDSFNPTPQVVAQLTANNPNWKNIVTSRCPKA
jgi:hypothetical protein